MAALDIIVNAVDKASPVIEEVGKKGENAAEKVSANWAKIGIASAAAGIAVELYAQKQNKLSETLNKSANLIGKSRGEMRDLALATTNVTFPLEEVIGSFDLLTKAGMRNTEKIAETATAYDTLGDAIGESATTVTGTMVKAMKTFGEEMDVGAEYTDKLAYVLKNTTLELGDFDTIIGRTTPEMVEMGLTMEDTLAVMGLLEEKGSSGTVAVRAYQKAMSAAEQAAGDLGAELGALKSDESDLMAKQEDHIRLIKDLEGAQKDLEKSTRDVSLSIRENAIDLEKATERLAEMQSEGQGENETAEQYSRRIEEQRIRIERLTNSQSDLKERQQEIAEATVETANAIVQETQAGQQLQQEIKANAEALDEFAGRQGETNAGLEAFYDSLGITGDQLDGYKDKLEGTAGTSQEYADIHAETYTIMDKMKQKVNETMFSFGEYGNAMSNFTPIMLGLGPAIKGVSIAQGLMSGSLIPLIASTWSMVAAQLALLLPYILIGLAIVAFIALLWYLYNNWEEVVAAIAAIWETIVGIVQKVWDAVVESFSAAWDAIMGILFPSKGLPELISDKWSAIVEFVTGIFGRVVDAVKDNWKLILSVLFPVVGLAMLLHDNWGKIVEVVWDLLHKVTDVFGNLFGMAKDAGLNLVKGLWDGISSLGSWIKDMVWGFAGGIFDSIIGGLGDLWPNSPSKAGIRIGAGLTEGISSGVDSTMSYVDRGVQAVEDGMEVEVPPPEYSSGRSATSTRSAGSATTSDRVEQAGSSTINMEKMFDGATIIVDSTSRAQELAAEILSITDAKCRNRGVLL